jgi:class 3 adenylate cyclase
MAERNTAVEPARRMQFRIGINLGDVIYDRERIFGDGINIAARLEGIAEPGGICVSAKVRDEIDGKMNFAYQESWRPPAQEHCPAGASLQHPARCGSGAAGARPASASATAR